MREMPQYEETPIGSYRLTRLIGVGPVSRVYLAARQDEPGRQVALKLFEAVPLHQVEEKDQALDEVRLLTCLEEHPSILPVLEDGIHENMLYLVMPYVEAGSLRQRLTAAAGELLPLKEVMAILRQIGEALHFAHTQQVVHANLKPENILFQGDGKVFLADFLLPSLVKSERAARILSTFAALYMAPEQFQGAATPLSDQYSLACLAYELLTGHPPFEADDFMRLVRKHATEQPTPPSQLQPKRAQHIDHAILKALVKRPEGRYPDIQTFLTELNAPPPLASLSPVPEAVLPRQEASPAMATSVVAPPAPVQKVELLALQEAPPLPAVPPAPGQEIELLPPQEAFPVPSAPAPAFSQEMVPFSLPGVSPLPSAPDVHNEPTVPMLSAAPASSVPAAVPPLTRASRPASSRLTCRQIWLAAGLVALAMLLSLSGVFIFFNASANHSPSQVSGKPTATLQANQLSPVATSTPGALPTSSATSQAKPTPTATPATPTPPPATSTAVPSTAISCVVSYTVASKWSGGLVVNISITNKGTGAIHGWTLAFTLPNGQHITNGWNGNFKQNGAQVNITDSGYNATIAPDSSVSPGFQATSNGNNSVPTAFSLNGASCR